MTFAVSSADRVELWQERGTVENVVLAAEGEDRYTGQLFDDDLAELWRRSARGSGAIFRPERGVAERPFLSVYPLQAAGTSPLDVQGPKQTGAALESFHVRFSCEPASVPQARERLRAWCHEARTRGDIVADVQLAATEAAANSVRHSGCAEFEIQAWMRHAAVVVSASDHGRGRGDPQPGPGVGITVTRALADSVDFEDTQPGTRVTMRFPRTTYP